MNEDLRKNLENAGIQFMGSNKGDYEVVAQFNPVQRRANYHNYNFQDNIKRMSEVVNKNTGNLHTSVTKDLTGPNGEKISRMFSTPFNNEGQLQVEKFNQLTKANEVFAFDIETIGDALNKRNFSVSEVAIQGFQKRGDNLIPSNKSLTQIIAPSTQVQNDMTNIIKKLKADPYSFNMLPEYQKRSVIDLSRYSTANDPGITPAVFQKENGSLVDIQHNTLASQLLKDEQIVPSRVIDNMPSVIKHAEAGLATLSSKDFAMDSNEAINKINQFQHANRQGMFVSYNGDHFDIPALQAWSSGRLNKPVNHLDYYRVIQTVYPNPMELHKEVDPDLHAKMLSTNSSKLQSLRNTLGFDTELAHSATHDIGEEGLGGVIDRTMHHIRNRIDNAKRGISEGFQFNEPGFTWSDSSIEKGQKLFAVGGIRARRDGELSFSARFDPTSGTFNPINDSFNTTIINAKTMYEVEDLINLSDNNNKRYGLQLLNTDTGDHSFIIREGEDAIHKIGGFIQSRFHNFDNMPYKEREEIREAKLTDRARRKYEGLFSLSKGGKGKTGGFEASKRLYENAGIIEGHISNKPIQSNVHNNLMQNEELQGKMKGKFNSLWDPEQRGWTHNQKELEEFHRMGARLVSERPFFTPALSYIEENLQSPEQRDMAWRLYSNKVNEHFPLAKENIELKEFESRNVPFRDFSTNRDLTLNMRSQETAMQSIQRFVYDIKNRDDLAPDLRQDRYRERLNLLVKNLMKNDVISDNIAEEMTNIANDSTVHNAILEVTDILQNQELPFQKEIKQTSLGINTEIQNMNQETNQLMFQEAVKKVREFNQTEFHPNQIPGSQLSLSPSVEKALSQMDQTHLSGLDPRNKNALEQVVGGIMDHERYRDFHFAVSLDQTTSNAKISVYRPEHSTSVMEYLTAGETHPNVLDIEMPLISEQGVHTIGNRRLNARTIADYENGRIIYKSTAESIAERYLQNMHRFMSPLVDGDFNLANQRAKRALNDTVEELSGIQRNLSFNDTYDLNYNQSDFFKQSQVEIERAMIKSMYEDGSLSQRDFREGAFIDGKIKPNISLEDLHQNKSYEVLLSTNEWLQDKGLNLYSSTVKGDHVSLGRMSQLDIRDYIPYGHYTFMGRDNTVQYMNTHILSPDLSNRLQERTKGYLSFNELVTTDSQRKWMSNWREQAGGSHPGVNIKAAYINEDQLSTRLQEISKTEEGLSLLQREGIINEDGTWNHTKMPTVYENQGLVASDIQNEMRVTEQKILTQSDDIRLFKNIQEGSHVNPGDVLGFERVEGLEREIRYQGKDPGRVILQNGRVGVSWEEEAFKYMVEGEKITDLPISRELIGQITGDQNVSVLMNANIQKHKDFAMLLSGKAKLLSEHIRELEDGQEKNRAIRMASKVNLEWDQETQTFIQRGTQPIPQSRFDRIFSALGVEGQTSEGMEAAILEMRASKVSNYSSMTDETGRQVLSLTEDSKGNPVKRYLLDDEGRPVRGGVRWGHREMGVLRDLGLEDTYQHLYYEMMDQSLQKGRLNETKGMIAALNEMAHIEEPKERIKAALSAEDFRSLPEIERDRNTYKNTVFDKEHIQSVLGQDAHGHGYWFNLPSIEDPSGNVRNITANIHGRGRDRVAIDKIFIPFTKMDETQGKVHLRELQKSISDIYRKADNVERSGSYSERSAASAKLQDTVDKYFNQLAYDVTSSKGQTGESVLRASMPSSGSGLFKLLDPEVSMDLDGEFTFISPDDAKKMGVFDKLKDIEAARAAGETIDDLYTMNIRYPTFHSKAMQVAKLRMSDDIRSGEFKTTSWISDLMKADSDGDYDYITTIMEEDVQSEWKELYDRRQNEYQLAYEEQMTKDSRAGRRFTPEYVLDGESKFEAFTPNSQDEMAAKIGKRVVGSSSNLNLYLRQISDEFLDHSSEERLAIHQLGEDIEQKLISSKHGLTVEKGRAPAIELINSIKNSNWSEAREIQQLYFQDDFDPEIMEKAFSGISEAKRNLKDGLYSQSLRPGTSHGVDTRKGLMGVSDMLMGTADLDSSLSSNTTMNLIHQMMDIDNTKKYIDPEGVEHLSVDPYESIFEQKRRERHKGLTSKLGDIAEDVSSVGHREGGSFIKNAVEAISENRAAKWGVVGSGLALAALGTYNIFRNRDPIENPIEYEGEEYYNRSMPESNFDLGSNVFQGNVNADIQVSASGSPYSEQDLSLMINQGMTDANMNTGNTRFSINHTDNTNKLNRIWYRDRIQENM